ncbi:hypothetical protein LEP1GSC127_0931 [Leptospira kirschneri str. 200801925]|uniref:Uncharacterized protein n=1 Tax=Leptospira kirschneri str. 200802841 TaxID=1193047 RepID=A0A828Y6M3_9LEPT|nr:hypothetical protein LEP1GSC131_2196 [Leptospira kirschneri str. 200802841]EMO75419.1 hypothetical protein LEP1GSC127_0931 [Leptospira kirschneri str. 200801925]
MGFSRNFLNLFVKSKNNDLKIECELGNTKESSSNPIFAQNRCFTTIIKI